MCLSRVYVTVSPEVNIRHISATIYLAWFCFKPKFTGVIGLAGQRAPGSSCLHPPTGTTPVFLCRFQGLKLPLYVCAASTFLKKSSLKAYFWLFCWDSVRGTNFYKLDFRVVVLALILFKDISEHLVSSAEDGLYAFRKNLPAASKTPAFSCCKTTEMKWVSLLPALAQNYGVFCALERWVVEIYWEVTILHLAIGLKQHERCSSLIFACTDLFFHPGC